MTRDWLREAVLRWREEKQHPSTGRGARWRRRLRPGSGRGGRAATACTYALQLTLVRRDQQVQGLLGEIGPDCHHLLPQLGVHLVLVNPTCAREHRRAGKSTCTAFTHRRKDTNTSHTRLHEITQKTKSRSGFISEVCCSARQSKSELRDKLCAVWRQ